MSSSLACGVRVLCRIRPKNSKEKQLKEEDDFSIDITEDTNIEINDNQCRDVFTFDRIYAENSTQTEIFETCAKPSIQDVLDGYNGTIFAYGQTGAGKTFTMLGVITDPQLAGIIPRVNKFMFESILSGDTGAEFTIKCSYLEIYNETVNCLLDAKKKNLMVRESPQKGVFVQGLTEEPVAAEEDLLDLIRIGDRNRAIGTTQMNAHSSRSHSLFQIYVSQKMPDGSRLSGKLNLVDLAGSEKVGKTGATGQTLAEAKKINQSLTALGKCINALSDRKTKASHIPYRDSKLTRILQESLGGNTKTTLLICCSPASYNYDETLSTLKFGSRAKNIATAVRSNVQKNPNELKMLVARLRKELEVARESEAGLKDQLSAMSDKISVDGPDAASLAAVLGAGSVLPVKIEPSAKDVNEETPADSKVSILQTKVDAMEKALADQQELMAERAKRIEKLQQENDELNEVNKQLREEIRALRLAGGSKDQADDEVPDLPRTRRASVNTIIKRGRRRNSVLDQFRTNLTATTDRIPETSDEKDVSTPPTPSGDAVNTSLTEPTTPAPAAGDESPAGRSRIASGSYDNVSVAETEPVEVLYSGWLKRHATSKRMKSLKKNFWVLTKDALVCYEDEAKESVKLEVSLRSFVVCEETLMIRGPRFRLVSGDKDHDLEADNETDRALWVDAIRAVIDSLIKETPILRRNTIEVHYGQGQSRTYHVDADATTVNEVFSWICDDVSLPEDRRSSFALVECVKHPDASIETSILTGTDVMSTVHNKWEKRIRYMGYEPEIAEIRFRLWLRKVFFHGDDELTMTPCEVQLEYEQAVDLVVGGHLSVDVDAFVLAACQVHVDAIEADTDDVDTMLASNIEKYLSAEYFKGGVSSRLARKEAKFARDIKAIRDDLIRQGVSTAHHARSRYLEILRGLPLYGAFHFHAKHIHWEDSANSGVSQGPLSMFVGRHGLSLVKVKPGKPIKPKDVLLSYSMVEIFQWGSNNRMLKLVTSHASNSDAKKKYFGVLFFATEEADRVCELIKTYALKAIALLEDQLQTGRCYDL